MNTTENKSKANANPIRNLPLAATLAIVSLLVAVLAFAIGLFNIKTSTTTKDQMANFIETQQTQFTTVKKDQEQSDSAMRQSLAKQEDNIKQLMQQLNNTSAEQVKSEAYYLIRLAGLNLRFSDDVNTSIRLLQLAAEQLDKFHTNAIEILKNNITNDIKKLQQLPIVDKAAVLSSLGVLQQQAQSLSILPVVEPKILQPLQPTPNSSTATWWQTAEKNLSHLKSLITVRKIDDPTSLTLSPDEILLTKEELLFKLNQAQWAVLNNNNFLFQKSLTDSIAIIDKLWLKPQEKTALLNSLNALSKIKLYRYVDTQLTSLSTKEEV